MSPKSQSTPLEDPIHFVGIGGSGMAGLAELALRRGLAVQGSDLKSTPASERLASLGARVDYRHEAALVGAARTLVYSSAIAKDNPELAKGRECGAKLLHRADFLGLLMQGKRAVTIAGTHGKSTTSAMVTHVLDALGVDPTAAIGGVMRRYGSAARAGKGDVFVAEADESDGSFLKYRPFVALVTNIDLDHMEYFKDKDGLTAAFKAYLANVDKDEGTAVVGWDNPLSRHVGGEHEGNRLTYGFLIGSDVRGLDFQSQRGETTFTAMVERDQVKVRLKAMGKHNAQNALGALAVVRALELDVAKAAASLADFQGVERRMTLVAESAGVHVYDDYAHNPGKIAACLAGLKTAFPDTALHVVYQAHRYSRLQTMYEDMLGALRDADAVYVVPVYSAGETTSEDFSPARLAEDLKRRFGVKALACKDLADAAAVVQKSVQAPSVILTVGAGDVWKVGDALKGVYQPR